MTKFIIFILLVGPLTSYGKSTPERPTETFELKLSYPSDSVAAYRTVNIEAISRDEEKLRYYGIENLFQWCHNVLFVGRTTLGINPQCLAQLISESGAKVQLDIYVHGNRVVLKVPAFINEDAYVLRLVERESGAYTVPTVLRLN